MGYLIYLSMNLDFALFKPKIFLFSSLNSVVFGTCNKIINNKPARNVLADSFLAFGQHIDI